MNFKSERITDGYEVTVDVCDVLDSLTTRQILSHLATDPRFAYDLIRWIDIVSDGGMKAFIDLCVQRLGKDILPTAEEVNTVKGE